MLPNFMVVGAQKAGTTSLNTYLSEHPDIYLPQQKETKFFVFDDRYAEGIESYQRKHYEQWSGERAVGEIDPDYMYFDVALDRMLEHLDVPNMKYIFILREPIGRAYSHYLMTYRRGLESLNFTDAIKAESERIAKSVLDDMHYSYVSRGFYTKQITKFLKHVSADRVHYVLSDDLRNNTAECLKNIFIFLDVDDTFVPSTCEKEFHSATKPKSMSLLKKVQGVDGWEKKLVRLLVPSKKIRENMRSRVLQWNQTTKGLPRLDESVRESLKESYRQEIIDLSRVTGLDLGKWS